MGATQRLFIAAALPPEAREAVGELAAALRSRAGAGLRWTPVGNLHLTLRFLGETPVEEVDGVGAAVEEAAADVPAFDVGFDRLGTFGGRRPRVLWLAPSEGAAELGALAGRIDEALLGAGVPAREGAFRPHLTLARVRRGDQRRAAAALAELIAGAEIPRIRCAVSGAELVRSELGADGARYAVLGSFGLAAGSTLRLPGRTG